LLIYPNKRVKKIKQGKLAICPAEWDFLNINFKKSVAKGQGPIASLKLNFKKL
jgi:hypothetical protein